MMSLASDEVQVTPASNGFINSLAALDFSFAVTAEVQA